MQPLCPRPGAAPRCSGELFRRGVRMPSTEPAADPLGILAEEFLDRFRRGERPAVSEYEVRLPEHAERIRQLFPVLVVMEEAGSSDRAPSLTGTLGSESDVLNCEIPDLIGGYRVFRVIGRGGMGVVYEAEQLALGRRVALKVLSVENVGRGSSFERFRREARSAARLHHTNIVPVYEVGEDAGRCFYAMQLIHGQPLDQVIDELRLLRPELGQEKEQGPNVARSLLNGFAPTVTHTPDAADETLKNVKISQVRSVDSGTLPGVGTCSDVMTDRGAYFLSIARIGVQVADALDYAHRENIVHRDVKPGNLLLDTDGRVWVADFGLAKSDADGLTRSGDIVGTVRYMAPERFHGLADSRSDVYALGLTLYELLVLRPAFDTSDRLALIKQIANSDPLSPRLLNRAVPRDLETIVLRAIEKEPARRYQTAAELAEDLRRFIDGRPVLARRLGWTEQVWRWAKRNRAISGLLSAVFCLLTVVAVVATVSTLRIAAAKKAAEGDRDVAQAAVLDGKEKLLKSYISEARANKNSRRVGQRFGTMDSIRNAVALARELEKPPELFDELRGLAIAALILPDLRADSSWMFTQTDSTGSVLESIPDPGLHWTATSDQRGEVRVNLIGSDLEGCTEIARLPGLGLGINMCWSKDGRYLSIAHGHQVRLQVWRIDANSHELVLDLPGYWYGVFAPDNKRILVSKKLPDGKVTLRTYSLNPIQEGPTISFPQGTDPGYFAPHPFREEVAAAINDGVLLVDLATGKELAQLSTPGRNGRPEWHPAGELLSIPCQDYIEVWDVARIP